MRRPKKIMETIGGIGLDTSFQGSTYKSRHVRVTKTVFLTVNVIEMRLCDSV